MMLSTEETIEFWNRRHEREDPLRSGGDIGLSPSANEAFYFSRLGKLVDLVGHRSSDVAPLFMLDAGCGKGYFSEALQRCGHRVTGIDASEHAIEHCRRNGKATYHQADLESFTSAWLYDVVYSVDVLFHILDDSVWERSLLNLASLVRLSGSLIVTDLPGRSSEVRGDYIVHRSQDAYLDVLGRAGLELTQFVPYDFLQNRLAFFCFNRVA